MAESKLLSKPLLESGAWAVGFLALWGLLGAIAYGLQASVGYDLQSTSAFSNAITNIAFVHWPLLGLPIVAVMAAWRNPTWRASATFLVLLIAGIGLARAIPTPTTGQLFAPIDHHDVLDWVQSPGITFLGLLVGTIVVRRWSSLGLSMRVLGMFSLIIGFAGVVASVVYDLTITIDF